MIIIFALLAQHFLSKSRTGLSLRAIGESPSTADAAGINVTLYKYLAVSIGAGISGLTVAQLLKKRHEVVVFEKEATGEKEDAKALPRRPQ